MEIINPYIYVGIKYVPSKKISIKTVGSNYTIPSQVMSISDKLESLLAIICESLGVTVEDAKGTVRDAEIVRARQIYSYLAKEMGYTYKKIGSIINRDHSTVIYACKIVTNRKFDFKILADYNNVIDNL
mgnify:CR=1 FL=1|tara:strand:- start:6477 stop:6863 length:387 start_codon:yes stop_codon:yes gene_type:complete